jgi:hypothetical protein
MYLRKHIGVGWPQNIIEASKYDRSNGAIDTCPQTILRAKVKIVVESMIRVFALSLQNGVEPIPESFYKAKSRKIIN